LKPPTTDQELLAALEEARKSRPDLGEIIDFHIEIITARSAIPVEPPQLEVNELEVARLMDERTPLLRHWRLEWDPDIFTALAITICDIGIRNRQDLAAQFQEVRELFNSDQEQVPTLVCAYLKGDKVDQLGLSEGTGDVLLFVLTHALHPFLSAFASALTPLIKEEQWYQRLCPVCGGEPDLGYLEQEVGGLRLLCSRCDTLWTSRRGECTYCGSSDKDTFAYYPSDDEAYRLYVCDNCMRYLKVLDGRQAPTGPLLPLQRIITVGMDMAARQQGYG
jgi:FdhE protein